MTAAAAPLGRDLKVMGLVGAAHWASHFYQLVLPPLFLFLKDEFGVSFAALGLLTTLLYGSSGLAQTVAGFAVDRFGARRVLLSGLTLAAVSTLAFGLVEAYWLLLPLSVLAGLGNSVFHPADLAILTSKVSEGRLGRGYASHALCGNLGWAAAPLLMLGLAQLWDWRVAVICAGLMGLVIVAAFLIWGADLADDMARPPRPAGGGRLGSLASSIRLLFSATIVSCFLYFAFLAAALIGVQNFGIPAMIDMYGVSLVQATAAVTWFLVGAATGILIGGFAADRTSRHDLIAMGGMLASALLMLYVAFGAMPAALLALMLAASGAASGVTTPSRDMLVRAAAPKGASGRVFGFVYSGLDLGSSMVPLALGWVLDRGRPEVVFHIRPGMAKTGLSSSASM
ncbi:MAG: MFS transporter, partial [Alphaproteobacteria bacterium]|nr:MFS transporter [Alphaproteobacteria bacterium]